MNCTHCSGALGTTFFMEGGSDDVWCESCSNKRWASPQPRDVDAEKPRSYTNVLESALNEWSFARSAAHDNGIGRMTSYDCAVITGEKLAELQDKARKYDEMVAQPVTHTVANTNPFASPSSTSSFQQQMKERAHWLAQRRLLEQKQMQNDVKALTSEPRATFKRDANGETKLFMSPQNYASLTEAFKGSAKATPEPGIQSIEAMKLVEEVNETVQSVMNEMNRHTFTSGPTKPAGRSTYRKRRPDHG